MIDERTPFVGCSDAQSYASPQSRWSMRERGSTRFEVGCRRRNGLHSSLFFSTPGVDIAARDVAVVERSWLCPFFKGHRGCICCQAVTASFRKGELHVITDVDGLAASSFMGAVSGRGTHASGDIFVDGASVSAVERTRRIGLVGPVVLALPPFTVSDSLWFLAHLYRVEHRREKRDMVESVAAFVSLDLHKKVEELTESETFRLLVAQELLLDTPALCFTYPFEAMTSVEQNECTELLLRVCRDLLKTVMISARSLSMPLLAAADTLLLFGVGGLVLYSGACEKALPYFNELRIPRYAPQPHWQELLGQTADYGEVENDPQMASDSQALQSNCSSLSQRNRVCPESRLCSVLCTPPRLSSRLFAPETECAAAVLLDAAQDSNRQPNIDAVVVVVTGGDLVDLAIEWSESVTQTMFYAAKFYDSRLHKELFASVNANSSPNSTTTFPGSSVVREVASCPRRFFALLLYTLRQIAVDAELLLGVALLSLGLIALSVFVQVQVESQTGMYNIRGLLFTAFVLVLLANVAALESTRDQVRVANVLQNRGLSGSLSFVACLCVRVVLIRLIYLILFLPFAHFVLRSSVSLAFLVSLVSFAHASFQYVAALLPSQRGMMWVSYLYLGYSIAFSGFLLNLRTLPPPLGLFSVVRWGYGAELHAWLHGKAFECDGANETSYCYTGDDYLAMEGLQKESLATSVLMLSVSGAVLMAFFVMRWIPGFL